jgi:predicted transcriptional regulator
MSDIHAVRLPENVGENVEELAERHDTTQSAVLRALVDNGLRARKWDEFGIVPTNHERRDAVEQASER